MVSFKGNTHIKSSSESVSILREYVTVDNLV